MAWLLDTNVISELRKGVRTNPWVQAWFETVNDADLYTSVLVMGEIRRGIELTARRDVAYAKALDRWLRQLEVSFAGRILPVTADIADGWGRLSPAQPLSDVDGLIAATTLHHGLILATRDTDIARSGVPIFNPFLA